MAEIKDKVVTVEALAAVHSYTKDYVNTKVADMVDSAPETLNTLNELAAALGDDPNFATTVATQIGNLEDKVGNESVSSQIDTAIKNYDFFVVSNTAPSDTSLLWLKPVS